MTVWVIEGTSQLTWCAVMYIFGVLYSYLGTKGTVILSNVTFKEIGYMKYPNAHDDPRHHATSFDDETINSSARFDLERIVHANASGYLFADSYQSSELRELERETPTHDIAPAVYSSFGIWGMPLLSATGEISNAARTEAIVIHIDERAM